MEKRSKPIRRYPVPCALFQSQGLSDRYFNFFHVQSLSDDVQTVQACIALDARIFPWQFQSEQTDGTGMAILELATVLMLAQECASPDQDPWRMAAIAKGESGFNSGAISKPNSNDTRDYGLMQINERNFGLLHLDYVTALDPCQSIRAADELLRSFSRYNTGSPTKGMGYAVARWNDQRRLKNQAPIVPLSAVPSVDEAVQLDDVPVNSFDFKGE